MNIWIKTDEELPEDFGEYLVHLSSSMSDDEFGVSPFDPILNEWEYYRNDEVDYWTEIPDFEY